MSICDMPIEVLCEIFGYLDGMEKLKMRATSQYFNTIICGRSFFGCKRFYSISEELERCKIARKVCAVFYNAINSTFSLRQLSVLEVKAMAADIALTRSALRINSTKFTDHGVNKFCDFWGLNVAVCKSRRMRGRYSLESISAKEVNKFRGMNIKASLPFWVEKEIKNKGLYSQKAK